MNLDDCHIVTEFLREGDLLYPRHPSPHGEYKARDQFVVADVTDGWAHCDGPLKIALPPEGVLLSKWSLYTAVKNLSPGDLVYRPYENCWCRVTGDSDSSNEVLVARKLTDTGQTVAGTVYAWGKEGHLPVTKFLVFYRGERNAYRSNVNWTPPLSFPPPPSTSADSNKGPCHVCNGTKEYVGWLGLKMPCLHCS